MSTEKERQDMRKATAYDLLDLLDKDPRETLTKAEIVALIKNYITAASSN